MPETMYEAALGDLMTAAQALEKRAGEVGIAIRWPVFQVGDLVIRHESSDFTWASFKFTNRGGAGATYDFRKGSVNDCWPPAVQARPREALARLNQIRAMTQWCNDRLAGLDRAVAEIGRQQARWQEQLDAERAMHALATGGSGA